MTSKAQEKADISPGFSAGRAPSYSLSTLKAMLSATVFVNLGSPLYAGVKKIDHRYMLCQLR
jgi:hypothetical protein